MNVQFSRNPTFCRAASHPPNSAAPVKSLPKIPRPSQKFPSRIPGESSHVLILKLTDDELRPGPELFNKKEFNYDCYQHRFSDRLREI